MYGYNSIAKEKIKEDMEIRCKNCFYYPTEERSQPRLKKCESKRGEEKE